MSLFINLMSVLVGGHKDQIVLYKSSFDLWVCLFDSLPWCFLFDFTFHCPGMSFLPLEETCSDLTIDFMAYIVLR